MLGVILGILKGIGILIGVILLLLLLIVGIVLFVPIQYRMEGRKKEQDLYAKAGISFFLRAVNVEASFEEKKMQMQIKIFGRTLEQWKQTATKWKRKKKRDKAQKEQRQDGKTRQNKKEEKPIIKKEDREKICTEGQRQKKEEKVKNMAKMSETEKAEHPAEQKMSNIEKSAKTIKRRMQKMTENLRNITEKVRHYYDLLREDSTKEAFYFCRSQLLWLLRKVAPRKMTGDVQFGTGDPAMTGQVMGMISVILPVYSYEIELEPDFEKKIFEGEVKVKGSVQTWSFVVVAWRLWRNKNLRRVIKKFRA